MMILKLYSKKIPESGDIMSDMGTLEASKIWGVAQKTVEKWCREGKITPKPTQDKPGSTWHIPKDAQPPFKRKGT